MITTITNARIFSGERVLNDETILIGGERITAVGGAAPAGATVVGAPKVFGLGLGRVTDWPGKAEGLPQ